MRHRLGGRGLALERPGAGQQLEGDDRERVAVARRGRRLAARLLRGEVPGRADDGARLGERGEVSGARDAEVGDLDPVVVVEQQVGGLDVAMDDPARVRGVERRRGLAKPVERAAERLCALAREPVGERSSRQVLHDDVGPPLVLADVEDRDDARSVRQPRGGEALAREAPSDRFVVGEALGEDLHRDGPRQVRVLGAVDLAHPAAGDPLRALVPRRQDVFVVHLDRLPGRFRPETRA